MMIPNEGALAISGGHRYAPPSSSSPIVGIIGSLGWVFFADLNRLYIRHTESYLMRNAGNGLGDHQHEVLRSLAAWGGSERLWARPMDIGGFSGSHHQTTLKSLIRLGLVERAERGGGPYRTAFKYRITPKGWEAARS